MVRLGDFIYRWATVKTNDALLEVRDFLNSQGLTLEDAIAKGMMDDTILEIEDLFKNGEEQQ